MSQVQSAIAFRWMPGIGSLRPEAPEVILLRAATTVRWEDGTSRDVLGEYWVTKAGREYRIIQWHMLTPPNSAPDPDHPIPGLPQ